MSFTVQNKARLAQVKISYFYPIGGALELARQPSDIIMRPYNASRTILHSLLKSQYCSRMICPRLFSAKCKCKCQGTCIAYFCSTEPARRSSYAPCLMGSQVLPATHTLYTRKDRARLGTSHPQRITRRCCSFHRPRNDGNLSRAVCLGM